MVDIIPANISTFATIAVGRYVYDTIETAGDADWFKVTLTAGDYQINLGGDPLFGNALSDTVLRVYDSAGNQLRVDDDNGAGSSSYLHFNAASSGTYYIGASAFSTNTGDYYLSLQKDDVPAAHDQSTQLRIVGSITGRLTPNDVDSYATAYLEAGVTYTFTLEGQGGVDGPNSDPISPALGGKTLAVYDALDNLVNMSSQPSGNAVVTFVASRSGTYSIDVLGFGGADQGYFSITQTASSIPINRRPSGADATITIAEDTPASFSQASFGFSDPDSDSFSSILVTSLPGAGRLTFNGVSVTVGQYISAGSLGDLRWTPPANGHGNGLAKFTFQVVDFDLRTRAAMDQTPNTITFNVTTVNDAPVITSGGGGTSAGLTVAENRTSVTTVKASDVDSTVSYAVAGADAGLFKINASTGVLSFRSAPDFEAPGDAGRDNVYSITLIATDGKLSDTQALQVTVANVAGNTIAGTGKGDTVDASHAIDSKAATGEEDYIDGRDGNDKLNGLAGNDTLIGGSGKDTLTGGDGLDRLTGGSGADRFVFAARPGSSNADTIVDFKHNSDRLALDDKYFKAIGSSLSSSEFYAKAGATSAHDGSDHIIYDKSTGRLYYDSDGKGGAKAVLFATLDTHPSLDHGDFLIV